MLIVSSDGNCT